MTDPGYVEVARAESERGELVLRERRADEGPSILELRANGVFVMDTAEFSSEEALASAALELVADPRDVLVGGLGLGFTMHRVLADPRVERCTVVEIEEELLAWMRDGTIPHGQAMLADERANPVVADASTTTRGKPLQRRNSPDIKAGDHAELALLPRLPDTADELK